MREATSSEWEGNKLGMEEAIILDGGGNKLGMGEAIGLEEAMLGYGTCVDRD